MIKKYSTILIACLVSQSAMMFSMEKLAALFKRDAKHDKKNVDNKYPHRRRSEPLSELQLQHGEPDDTGVVKGAVSCVIHCSDECCTIDLSHRVTSAPMDQCKSHHSTQKFQNQLLQTPAAEGKWIVTFLDAQENLLRFYPKDAVKIDDLMQWGAAKLDQPRKSDQVVMQSLQTPPLQR